MPLSVGTKLGEYEITGALGKGGMGEVYRAIDTKLKRDVALKVLPAALASDRERMQRFVREAEVLASLNHPNIAQIYRLEESGDIRAIVMECVEGETLAEIIQRGPIPLDTAINYAKQIASAFEYAHDKPKPVIHRDLKPANVKVTPEGVVKVLDFGLAKALSEERPERSNSENSPTLTLGPSVVGTILGTAAYMSPEQAKGKNADRRSDIWSFGVVLYEMVTGKRPFTGEEMAEVLAAVINQESKMDAVPTRLRPAIERCLRKDPRKRWYSMEDVRFALDEPEAEPEAGIQTPQPEARSASGKFAWMIAACVLAIGFIATSWIGYRATRPAELKPLVRLDVDLGSDVSLGAFSGTDAILSPDGSRLVYVSQGKLFTRKLDQPMATELAGTEGAFAPFFSPDGQWVAFFAQGKLKKISVEGGAAIALCDAPTARGGSWGEDGNIIAMLNEIPSRIPVVGGPPVALAEQVRGEYANRWPQVLPGGKAVLFTAHTSNNGFDAANIDVMTLADRRRKTLHRGGTYGRYLPSGHLVYVNKGTLFAVPFDLDKLEVRGTPVPVLAQVAYSPTFGSAQFAFAEARAGPGTLVYRGGGAAGGELHTVQWLDGAGKLQPLLAKPDSYLWPRVSPDGQRLALSTTDVWVYEWRRDTMTRLTFDGGEIPVWSPDGSTIVYRRQGEGLFWTRSDGAGKPQLLAQIKNQVTPFSFSPDGRRLAFQERRAGGQLDLWTVPLETDGAGLRAGKPEVFLQTEFTVHEPAFSPDGRWLAYTSDESGTSQVYVRAFPDKGGKWQISNSGGVYPVWSRNGRELFFRTVDSRTILVASYAVKGDSFVPDKPRVWSEVRLADTGSTAQNYDLAPDGKRIAALMPVEAPETQPSQNHVIFLENFFDELRRKVPLSSK